jgi:uncharacterized protein YacL
LALLAGAGFCGVASFVLQLVAGVFAGGASVSAILTYAVNALVLSFLFFVIGFAAGAIVVTPLFRMLEKAKRRALSPYAAAALGVAAASLIAAGALPWAAGPSLVSIIAVMLASIVTTLVFGARMSPVWRAAEKEEAASAPTTPFRLH